MDDLCWKVGWGSHARGIAGCAHTHTRVRPLLADGSTRESFVLDEFRFHTDPSGRLASHFLECKSNGGTAQVGLTVQSLIERICTLFGPLKGRVWCGRLHTFHSPFTFIHHSRTSPLNTLQISLLILAHKLYDYFFGSASCGIHCLRSEVSFSLGGCPYLSMSVIVLPGGVWSGEVCV